MNATVMRSNYAERKAETVPCVIKLGLIKVTRKHHAGSRARCYGFTDGVNTDRTESVRLKDQPLLERLSFWKQNRVAIEIRMHGPHFGRMLIDLCDLKLSPRGLAALEERVAGMKNKGSLNAILRRFRNGRGGWFRIGMNKRLATHVTQTPSYIRKELMIDGEQMVEMDIRCSHVAMILSLFSPMQRNRPEYQEIIRLIRARQFYELLRDAWAKDPDGTESEKVLFQVLVNDTRQSREDLPMWVELEKRFPLFVHVLVEAKRNWRRKGETANMVQGMEAQLIEAVVRQFQREGIRCFTVFDSIGVPMRAMNRARSIFDDELTSGLGFSLPVRVSSS